MAPNSNDAGINVAILTDEAIEDVVRDTAFTRRSGSPEQDWWDAKAVVLGKVARLSPPERRLFSQTTDRLEKKNFVVQFVIPASKPSLELPTAWIKLYAHRLFVARGRVHGFHIQDWFNAKADLLQTFAPLYWHPRCDTSYWATLIKKTLDDAMSSLNAFFADTSTSTADVKVPLDRRPGKDSEMPHIEKGGKPTARQLGIAKDNRDPLSFVPAAEKAKHRGKKIAVALSDGLRGTVIASATTRRDVRLQVYANGKYADVEYALCEVPK